MKTFKESHYGILYIIIYIIGWILSFLITNLNFNYEAIINNLQKNTALISLYIFSIIILMQCLQFDYMKINLKVIIHVMALIVNIIITGLSLFYNSNVFIITSNFILASVFIMQSYNLSILVKNREYFILSLDRNFLTSVFINENSIKKYYNYYMINLISLIVIFFIIANIELIFVKYIILVVILSVNILSIRLIKNQLQETSVYRKASIVYFLSALLCLILYYLYGSLFNNYNKESIIMIMPLIGMLIPIALFNRNLYIKLLTISFKKTMKI